MCGMFGHIKVATWLIDIFDGLTGDAVIAAPARSTTVREIGAERLKSSLHDRPAARRAWSANIGAARGECQRAECKNHP